MHLLAKDHCVPPPASLSAPLVALRRATMPFYSEYNLSSPSLVLALQAYENAGHELARIRESLLDALYRVIPSISDAAERHILLQIKRDIFQKRRLHTDSFELRNKPILKMLESYNRAWDARAGVLAGNGDRVVREIKAALDQLVQEPLFYVAVDYSCPWLLRRHRRAREEHVEDFSEQDRSLHSYATKFFSKANPFYTFSAIMPPEADASESSFSEIIINLSVVMSLERECLQSPSSFGRKRLYLCSYYEEENALSFLVPDSTQLRIVRLQRDAVAAILLSYFQNVGNKATAEHFLGHLKEHLPQEGQIQALLSRLIKSGIVMEYLVKDFRRFGRDLAGISPELDEKIELLDRYHLCRTTPEQMATAHSELHGCELPRTKEEPNLYYVNSYCSADLGPYLPSIEKVSKQLRCLAPLLTLKSNFNANAGVLRRYLTERLEAEPGKQLLLLQATADFLRNFNENVSRHQAPARSDAGDSAGADFPALAMLEGNISDTELRRLADRFSPGKTEKTGGVCLNGPFDFERGIFYLTNIFAGNGRAFARYFLGHSSLPQSYLAKQNNKDVLDVQIAAPVHQNRNFVAPMLMAGCGLEARYSHLFETWIDPSDVLIELSPEGIRYRHTKSGVRLAFHFFGVILADSLIAPYQLLLLDHADFYENPFEWQSFSLESGSAGPVQHIPGLQYRSVCLRRDQWLFPASEVNRIVARSEALLATVELRDAVHALTGIRSEYWFYKIFKAGKRENKPRFMDLCSPLSVLTLRKMLRSLPPESVLSFTEMRPGPQSGMFFDQGGPVSTEVMIEI
jgi:hypothetical protein